MQLLKLKTSIHRFDTFAQFAGEFSLGAGDLVLTNEFLYKPFMEHLGLDCRFVMQERYGLGEPSDEMMNRILADLAGAEYDRVVAVGGGTVIDIAKLFVLAGVSDVTEAFERKIPIVKSKKLVIVPTTCGTGSEVTNISIAELRSRGTKMGLADDALLADDAVLVPELLKGLPFKFYVFSAIDALIHATESYVSPRSNPYTQMFCREAIRTIVDVFGGIAEKGPDYRFERLEEMLVASNYAGIAFGSTGVGAVHALSYPMGGTYHVPHGEANFLFFVDIFKLYGAKNPDGIIAPLEELYAELLGVPREGVYDALEELLGRLTTRKPLREYGMKEADVAGFAASVIATQQRLLGNNYVPLSEAEIREVYAKLY